MLTNGRVWNFYTDLDKANILDERPFLVLDLLDIDPVTVPKLEQLAKGSFDLDSVIAAAEELKYVSAIKREISAEMAAPSDELVKVLAKRVYSGYMNAKAVETFTRLTEEAARQYINDRVNARLKTALGDQVAPVLAAPAEPVATGDQTVLSDEENGQEGQLKPGVVTTEEEIEGFRIIKAILAGIVPMNRVYMRDAASYCSVILDDNNRKPIARLHFDGCLLYTSPSPRD